MKSNLKPAVSTVACEEELIKQALALLAEARDRLKRADCPKTLARVRLTISSCKGALANARYRFHAAQQGRPRKRIRRAPRFHVQTLGYKSPCANCGERVRFKPNGQPEPHDTKNGEPCR